MGEIEKARICRKCGEELPIEMFDIEHTKHGDIRRRICKKCRRETKKAWRENNRELYIAQAIRRQNKQTELLHSLKKPCIVCGEAEPVCIDFHHINPEDKEFTVGKYRSRGKEWLIREISKCVCLCSNCHRKVHAGLIDLNLYIKND